MTYGMFDYKKDVEDIKYAKVVPAPYTTVMPVVPIPPPLPYGGMLPKLNRGYGGKILDSHVGPGGIHGDRKY